jgi:hypothetical protein
MSSFALLLPRDFDDYEWEVRAKGFFSEARLSVSGTRYRLNFYDCVRLSQEIESELQRGRVFFEPNLVVVSSVTRSDMERAADDAIRPRSILDCGIAGIEKWGQSSGVHPKMRHR